MQASHTLVLLEADNKKNHSHDMLETKVHSAYLYSMFQNDSIHHRHSGTRKSIVKLGKMKIFYILSAKRRSGKVRMENLGVDTY